MWHERQTRYAYEDSPQLDTRQRHRSKGSVSPLLIFWLDKGTKTMHADTHTQTQTPIHKYTHAHTYACT